MKKFVITAAVICSVLSAHAGDTGLLDKMQKDIVKQETQKAEEAAPDISVPKEKTVKEKEKIISFSISHRDCVAQGNTPEECETLTKNKQTVYDNYDIKNPKIPSLSEGKEDIFLNLKIRH